MIVVTNKKSGTALIYNYATKKQKQIINLFNLIN